MSSNTSRLEAAWSERATTWKWSANGFISAGLAVGTYWGVQKGSPFVDVPAMAAVVAAIVLVPTMRHLSGRIMTNGSLALTVVPVVGALPLPITINRGGVLASGAVAGLALFARRRWVLPRVALIDVVPVVAAAVAALAVRSFLLLHGAQQALVRLLPGYDYSAHFDMFEMLREHGRSIASLGVGPDGSGWAYSDYPLGYHSACAMIADLVGPDPGPTRDLVSFVVANGVLVVAVVTVLVAGLCSLRQFRENQAYAPFACFLVLCIVFGVSSRPITNGFVNFWLAAVLAALAVLVAMVEDAAWPLRCLAVQGLIAGTAFTWLPLTAMAAPSVCVLMRHRPGHRQMELSFCAAGLALSLVPLDQVWSQQGRRLTSFLDADGAFVRSHWTVVAAAVLLLLSFASTAAADRKVAGSLWIVPRRPAAVLVPLVGAALVTALGVLQLVSAGELTYYFYKLVVGVQTTAAVLLVATLVPLAAEARRARNAEGSSVIAVLGVLLLVCLGGVLGLFGATIGPAANFPNTATFSSRDAIPSVARELLDAAAWETAHPELAGRVTYVPLGPGAGPSKAEDAQWFMALTGTFTENAAVRQMAMGEYGRSSTIARRLGTLGPSLREPFVLTAPAQADDLRQALREAGVRRRVVSWVGKE